MTTLDFRHSFFKSAATPTPLRGKDAPHPLSPAPKAGVSSHLPRSAGEDGKGRPHFHDASREAS